MLAVHNFFAVFIHHASRIQSSQYTYFTR